MEERNYELPDDTRIMIATPNYTNTFSAESHTNHLECVVKWTEWGIPFNWMIQGRTFVHYARSQACRLAIDGGYTHLFWVDDDAIIHPEMLPKFVQHDKDVVIAPYPMRRSPFEIGLLSATSYVCNDCGAETIPDGKIVVTANARCTNCDSPNVFRNFHKHGSYRNFNLTDMDQGLVDIDGGGTHAMLVKMEALTERRGWPPPTFGEPMDPENHSYPEELLEVYNSITSKLTDEQKETIHHFLGDLPDQSLTFEEEDKGGKPFFMMPKTGTEDMYWCLADGVVYGDFLDISQPIAEAITHKGTKEEADQHHKREFNGELVNIRPFYTESLRLTPNHGVLTQRGWVEAGSINENDMLFLPKPKLNDYVHVIDLAQYAQGAIIDDTGIWFNRTTVKAAHIPAQVPMNTELAWLFGFYVAEGSGTENTVTFSYNAETENDYADRVEAIARKNFGITNFDRQRNGNSGSIRFSNKVLAKFFKDSFGEGARNKRFPSWICDNIRFSGEVLRGLWDGDGMLSKKYHLTTISRNLAHQVKGLLAANDIMCGISPSKTLPPRNTRYAIYPLSGFLPQFGELISFEIASGIKDNSIARVNHLEGGDGWMIKIRKISREDFVGTVYNVGVPDTHSYVVNGIAVHNCYRAKCKGIEIFADTDEFADHVSFPPVITKQFTQRMEDMKNGSSISSGSVEVIKSEQRSHTGINIEKAGNLI